MFPFTPSQKEAIRLNDSNLRIIACAGSGKTSTIAGKVAYLLNPKNGLNIAPKNIIAFTYTEKAAAELSNKVQKFIKDDPDLADVKGLADMYIGTIHGWCLKALQENEYDYQKFNVLDEIRLRLFVDKNFDKIGMKDIHKLNDNNVQMKIFTDTGRFIQIMNIIRESELNEELPNNIQIAKEKYEQVLKDNSYFDFTMIMTETLKRLGQGNPLYHSVRNNLKYLIVDEYQDINPIQEQLIYKLYKTGTNTKITVVGDDDQNIYQWRGSNNAFIKNFMEKYTPSREIILNENFRSSVGITTLAETLISKNDRIPKMMISARKQEFIINEDLLYNEFENVEEENEYIANTIASLIGLPFEEHGKTRGLAYSDFVILLRSWSKTKDIAQTLDRHGINYITAGVNQLFQVPEVIAALGIFEYLYEDIDYDELYYRWSTLPNNNINKTLLKVAISALNEKLPEKSVDKKGKPIWAYNLQGIYWEFLENAEINESSFVNQTRGEIIMYNLGKFSQVISDFEEINYNSSLPSFHLFSFLNFIKFAAIDYYPEGWLNNPYKTPNAIQIMTIHQAKGLEFPVVFIPGMNKNYFPAKKPGGLSEWHFLDKSIVLNQDRYIGDISDERRLFYVAVTRAKKFLFISRAPNLNNQLYRKKSEFINDLTESDVIVENLPTFEDRAKIKSIEEEKAISITLNFSVLKDFFECPYRFKLISMYGFNYPLDQRMGYGRSMHNSLMELHKRIKGGEKLDEDTVLEIVERQSHFPYLGKSTMLSQMKDIVKKKVLEYYETTKETLSTIEYIEQEIQLNLDEGILVSGRIDLIKQKMNEKKYETTIIEFKSDTDAQKKKQQ